MLELCVGFFVFCHRSFKIYSVLTRSEVATKMACLTLNWKHKWNFINYLCPSSIINNDIFFFRELSEILKLLVKHSNERQNITKRIILLHAHCTYNTLLLFLCNNYLYVRFSTGIECYSAKQNHWNCKQFMQNTALVKPVEAAITKNDKVHRTCAVKMCGSIGVFLIKLFLTHNCCHYWCSGAINAIMGQFECKLCLSESILWPTMASISICIDSSLKIMFSRLAVFFLWFSTYNTQLQHQYRKS